MSDYINYIDFNAIQLADLANEIGDYKLAKENYSKALSRLRRYQGDRMQPMMMASEFINKIETISKKNSNGKSILKCDTWKLTKSSFVKGNQCIKYLYLDKHKKQEKTPVSKETLKIFNQGHSFENMVREQDFPDGTNIKDTVGNFSYFNSYTKYLLNLPGSQVLYEATIIEEEVLIMCDVLVKNEDGLIDIFEIKLNTEINEAIKSDLAVQYYISKKRFGNKLNSFNVILRNKENIDKWTTLDLKRDLELECSETEQKINDYKDVLLKSEPEIKMGEQCNKPYKCEFIEYCKKRANG